MVTASPTLSRTRPQTGTWSVRFGTGTGFSNAKPIFVPNAQFALSRETENCGGTRSDTTNGLYDMDGDGQPEVIVLNDGRLDVYQLNAERTHHLRAMCPAVHRGPPSEDSQWLWRGHHHRLSLGQGRLITWHQVPFPEIVVTAVGTSDEFGSSLEAPTLYAYGDAELHFDPKYGAFIFPGYKRSVALRITSDQVPPADGRRRNHHRDLPARAIRREHGCECPLQALPESRTCQRRHDDQRKRRQGSLDIAGYVRQRRPASYRQYALRLGHAPSPYGSYG